MAFKYIRTLLPAVMVAASLAGSARAGCPPGDLNGDCRVDLLDVQVLARQWLTPSERAKTELGAFGSGRDTASL